MIFEVINKEHIPEDTSIVATSGCITVAHPNGSIAQIRCYLPEEKNCQHVSGPDTDQSVEDGSEIKFDKTFCLLHLVHQTDCDQESSDPEESVNCEISSWDKSGETWSIENVKSFHPIFYVHESEPHIMSENNPENR